jgi:hypothetical protein
MLRLSFKKLTILPILIFLTQYSIAQDNNEIQVYGSATTPKYTTMIELHSNYSITGPKFNQNYHPFLQTLEVTTGISENFEFGFYIFTYNNNGKIQYTGTNIRPRVKAPDEWNLPMGISLSSEIGCSIDPTTKEKDWGAEIRPIFDKTVGDHYVSFNPNIGVSFTNKEYLFEPILKYAYTVSKKVNVGFEYYGNTGKIFNAYKLPNQEHQLFLAIDLFLHPLYEFNFGIGKGMTDASNGTTVKCYIGRRINWKHPKETK